MSNRIKIVPKVSRLIHLIDRMEGGEIKIPSFQRDYVWSKKQREELFESIQLEYPIGSILLWRPDKEFKINHQLGPVIVKKTSQGFFYILDGFQRLSTLYGCLINPEKTENEIDQNIKKDFLLYYDLENEEFNSPRSEPIEITNIPIFLLIDTFGYLDFSERLRGHYTDREYANKLIERGRKLSSTLIDYEVPYVEIYGGDIEKAVNIFSRVNSKGSPISKDWMVSALTSNEERDFNLGDLIDELLDELRVYNFQDLKREVVLQCIQNSFGKIYYDLAIEDLVQRNDFIEKAKKTIKSIKEAVNFLFEELYVLERRLLPYNNQLVFITYFFSEVDKYAVNYPTQLEKLKEWFWVTSYANYFTIYTISKTRYAFKQFKAFVKGDEENPVFNDKPSIPFSTAEFPVKILLNSVRSTALILFLLNHAYRFQGVKKSRDPKFEMTYIYKGIRTPANLIPNVKFKSDNLIQFGNYSNLSFLSTKPVLKQEYKSIFLTEDMVKEDKKRILELREELIIDAEEKFVTKLGLYYYNIFI